MVKKIEEKTKRKRKMKNVVFFPSYELEKSPKIDCNRYKMVRLEKARVCLCVCVCVFLIGMFSVIVSISVYLQR